MNEPEKKLIEDLIGLPDSVASEPDSRLSFTLLLIPALISILVLGGWQLNLPILKSVLPGSISMKPNTAVGLIFLSVTAILFQERPPSSWRRMAGLAGAAIVFLLAIFTLSEYLFHRDYHIDELLFLDLDAQKTRWPPGRFAPVTCLCFIFVSVSLFLEGSLQPILQKTKQALLIVAWMIAFQALVAYFVGVTYVFGSAYYTQIAVHTALSLVLLTTGLLMSRSKQGFMVIMMRPTLAGMMGRRLLISAILVPPLINWLQVQGVAHGFWDPDFGVLLRVVGSVLFFSWIAVQTTLRLTVAEEERALALKREFAQSHQRQVTQARLDLITNAIPAFISYVDRDQKYLFANSAYENWFGLSPEQVVGRSTKEILGLSYAKAELFIQQALAGQSVRYQNRIVDQHGADRYFEADYVPDISIHDEVRGFVIIGHDVTERIKSEENLAAAVKARDELLSICSHELRTPVTSMKLSTQMVLRDLRKDEPQIISPERILKIVEQSDRQLDRLTRLIEEMLDFARVSSGKLAIQPAFFNLSTMVRDTLDRMRPQFEAAGCAIVFKDGGEVVGHWDSFRLEQVLTKLLSNSLKYASQQPITVQLAQDRDFASLSIQDRGIGISNTDQARIFEPYERAVSIHNFGGLGLGLYISSQIVKAHGGSIDVKSSSGGGATFTVKLPKQVPEGFQITGNV